MSHRRHDVTRALGALLFAAVLVLIAASNVVCGAWGRFSRAVKGR